MSGAPIPSRRRAVARLRARSLARGAGMLLVLTLARPVAAQDTTRARPASRTITLQQAIAIALAQSSTARFAENTARLDSLDVRSARNQCLPSLSASSVASRRMLSGSRGGNTFGADASVSGGVTLYNGGQNVNALRQAQQTVRASSLDVTRARQGIVFTVATDYLDLITQQDQIGVQQENLTAQEQELRQLQEFVRLGTRPIGDVYQQQAAVASTRLALVTARRNAEVAAVNLIQELVLDPRVDWVFATPLADSTPPAAPAFRLDSLVDVAMRRRVDIQAQRFRVRAAESQIAIARGTRLPTITGSAGFSSEYASGTDVGFLRQLDARRGGSVGVGVSVPVFDRGASSIAQQRARVQLDNELLALRDQEQAAALEVRRAYLDYAAAGEQLAAATAQQEAAALALQAAQARYRVGAATFIEVTLARATLIQAQTAVVSARSAVTFQQALMSYYTGVLDPSNVSIVR
jgi:outer membrane protein